MASWRAGRRWCQPTGGPGWSGCSSFPGGARRISARLVAVRGHGLLGPGSRSLDRLRQLGVDRAVAFVGSPLADHVAPWPPPAVDRARALVSVGD